MLSIGDVTGSKLKTYYDQDDYFFKRDQTLEVLGSGRSLYRLDKLKTDPRELFERLTKNRKRRAIDVTLSPPKSLSILFAIGNEEFRDIAVDAQQTAVKKTLEYIEESGFFRTQRKENGRVVSSPAKGMVGLPIFHSLNRKNEPQLHDHTLIANSGIDPDGKERAVDYGYIYRNQKHLDMIYKSVLRAYLEQAGLSTRSTEDGFELNDISREQIEHFSSRSKQIEDNLEAMGLTRQTATAEQRQAAAMKDRPTKSQVDMSELGSVWEELVKEVEISVTRRPKEDLKDEMSQIFYDAINAHFGTVTTTSRKEIIGAVLKHANTLSERELSARLIDFEYINSKLEDVLRDYEMITLPGQTNREKHTQELISARLLRAESVIKEYARQGRETYPDPDSDIASDIDAVATELFDFQFVGEQRDAAIGILQSRDFLTCVQGDPGTGKTTMLRPVVAVHGPARILGLSVSGAAAKKLGDEAGIEARTLSRFVLDYRSRKRAIEEDNRRVIRDTQYIEDTLQRDGIIIVDEASMLGSEDAAVLCKIAREYGAKLVMCGDRYQLPGVSAGTPFSNWIDEGATTFKLTEIRRQKGRKELEAVKAVTLKDDVKKAVEILADGRCVNEFPEPDECLEAIVEDYMGEVQKGQYPLIITGKNNDRKAFNQAIRDRLQSGGLLEKGGEKIIVRDSQKRESEIDLVPGDRIVFLQNDNKGKVQITGEGSAQKVLNGQCGRITSLFENEITADLLDDDGNPTGQTAIWSLDDYNFINHSYALTVHKSQGQSVNRLVQYHAHSDSCLLTRNEFLVGISRNINAVKIYTDNRVKMTHRASQGALKDQGLELFKIGVEKTRDPSNYVAALVKLAREYQARSAAISERRDRILKIYNKLSNTPKIIRDELNKFRDDNRKKLVDGIKAATAHLPQKPSLLEREACQMIDAWRETIMTSEKKFEQASKDGKGPAKSAFLRRRRKFDGKLVADLESLQAGGKKGLDDRVQKVIDELQKNEKTDLFEKDAMVQVGNEFDDLEAEESLVDEPEMWAKDEPEFDGLRM
ncbi:MAG: relaxase domain-containing protein [Deltaproteobacteria bacterium]|nr:relaxase domain-containing protein [Deltaproteobacteria bacterium]